MAGLMLKACSSVVVVVVLVLLVAATPSNVPPVGLRPAGRSLMVVVVVVAAATSVAGLVLKACNSVVGVLVVAEQLPAVCLVWASGRHATVWWW